MSRKPFSANAQTVLDQARDIAGQVGQNYSTAHILLAFFVTPNSAERLLSDLGINEEVLLAGLASGDSEGVEMPIRVEGRAAAYADATGADAVFCLHILAAMSELSDALAYRLMACWPVCGAGSSAGFTIRGRGGPRALAPIGPRQARTNHCALRGARRRRCPAGTGHRFGVTPGGGNDSAGTCRGAAGPIPTWGGAYRTSLRRGSFLRAPNGLTWSSCRGQTEANGRRSDRTSNGPVPHDASPQSPFALDGDTYEWLTRLGRNLSESAWNDAFDPVIGRDREIEETVDILNKRRSNNPCLVGEPGVGKTAIVEGVVSG